MNPRIGRLMMHSKAGLTRAARSSPSIGGIPEMKILIRLALPAVLALAAFAPTAQAEQPGQHPHYLHALSDLRDARANLQKRGGDAEVKWDEAKAIADIDAAIGKIKGAAVDDGKNLDDHPAVDAPDRRRRLHKALVDLQAARDNVNMEEDNNFAQGLKARALHDVESALGRTREGLCNAGDTSFCPK
jgi:hypothetical protein